MEANNVYYRHFFDGKRNHTTQAATKIHAFYGEDAVAEKTV